jgi:hypothetical protein
MYTQDDYIQDELDFQSNDDIQAAANFFDNFMAGTTPTQLANNYANLELNINLSDGQLNKVLGMYATSLLTIEQCVDAAVF